MEPTPVPNALTTDKYFINRHHWLLWIPSLIGLFIGMYVGGSIADKDKLSQQTTTVTGTITPTVSSKPTPSSSDWITYTNMIDRYYFMLPRGWSITEGTSQYGTTNFEIGNDDPKDLEIIGVTKVPNPTHLSVEAFVKKYYPNQTAVFTPTSVSDNVPALQTTFSDNSRDCKSAVVIFLPHMDSMFEFSHTTCIPAATQSRSDDTIFRRLLKTVQFSDTPLQTFTPITPQP